MLFIEQQMNRKNKLKLKPSVKSLAVITKPLVKTPTTFLRLSRTKSSLYSTTLQSGKFTNDDITVLDPFFDFDIARCMFQGLASSNDF